MKAPTMTEAAMPLADELERALQAAWDNSHDGFEIHAMVEAVLPFTRSPLPGAREEVARADREALEKIERRDRYWVSSFDAEGKVALQIDEINMRSLVLGPAGEIARAARADLALPPAPMPEREEMRAEALIWLKRWEPSESNTTCKCSGNVECVYHSAARLIRAALASHDDKGQISD